MPTIITGTPIDEIANIVASFSSKLKHKIISFQKFTDSFKAKIYAGKLITVDINAGPRRDKNATAAYAQIITFCFWMATIICPKRVPTKIAPTARIKTFRIVPEVAKAGPAIKAIIRSPKRNAPNISGTANITKKSNAF